MTRWGLMLLLAYVVLGLSDLDSRKASRLAVAATVVVIAGVSLKVGAV